MTVSELIEELKKFDSDLVVIIQTNEDAYTTYPRIEKYDFDFHYWDDRKLKYIPKNQSHLEL